MEAVQLLAAQGRGAGVGAERGARASCCSCIACKQQPCQFLAAQATADRFKQPLPNTVGCQRCHLVRFPPQAHLTAERSNPVLLTSK